MLRAWRVFVLSLISILFVSAFSFPFAPSLLLLFTTVDNQTHYYLYNPLGQKQELLMQKELTGYPTAMLSKDGKRLFYTDRDSRSRTQLFQMDLITQTRKQLTTRFSNVDFLHIDEKNRLHMRVLQPQHRNLQMAVYDPQTGKTDIWNPAEKDMAVHDFDTVSTTGQTIAVIFSAKEEYALIAKANKQQTPLEPPFYHVVVYGPSGKPVREVLQVKKHIIDMSASPSGKTALLTVADEFSENAKHTVYLLDIPTRSMKPLFSDTQMYGKIKQARFATNEQKVYFLATRSSEKDTAVKPRSLWAYCFKTKQVDEIWRKDNGTINNYLVM